MDQAGPAAQNQLLYLLQVVTPWWAIIATSNQDYIGRVAELMALQAKTKDQEDELMRLRRFQSRFQFMGFEAPTVDELTSFLIFHELPRAVASDIAQNCGGDVRQALNSAEEFLISQLEVA